MGFLTDRTRAIWKNHKNSASQPISLLEKQQKSNMREKSSSFFKTTSNRRNVEQNLKNKNLVSVNGQEISCFQCEVPHQDCNIALIYFGFDAIKHDKNVP